MTRRKFLGITALSLPALVAVDAGFVEPTALRVRHFTLNRDGKLRFVHISDFHHRGDVRYAEKIVRTINALGPAFVCFTGDLVEDKMFATEALQFIRKLAAPVYGSPGNHDYWSRAPFEEYERAFAATGGAWLADRGIVAAAHDIEFVGMARNAHRISRPPASTARHILLTHYPITADQLRGRRFDLILSGHSHGGQIRVPFYGALIVPWGVGRYDMGFFETKGGPLYVNAGLGTLSPYGVRFNCPPEVTLVTM